MVESKTTEKVTKKAKSKGSGGGGKKKLTTFQKFMKTEISRLQEDNPSLSHQDRFKMATSNWKTSKLNPRATAATE